MCAAREGKQRSQTHFGRGERCLCFFLLGLLFAGALRAVACWWLWLAGWLVGVLFCPLFFVFFGFVRAWGALFFGLFWPCPLFVCRRRFRLAAVLACAAIEGLCVIILFDLGPFLVPGTTANMDASFRAAATFFKRAPQQLGHKAKVVRLYRHSLKAVVSWAVDRDLVNSEASRIRGLFEENRNASPDKAARLIREAQAQLHLYTHPDKYVVPYMPGGSKFMRNAPPALEVRRESELLLSFIEVGFCFCIEYLCSFARCCVCPCSFLWVGGCTLCP